MYIDEERKPEPLSTTNVILALGVHIGLFALLWVMGQLSLREKEVVIPIDLTVVVEENLDGKENEPPPLEKPKPPPPPDPEPEPPKPPELPKPEPKPVVEPEAVEQIVEKKKEEKKPEKPKEIEKKKDPEKPKKPKKTREQILEEIRKRAVDNPRTSPRPERDGKTGRKTLSDAEIQKRLAAGYKAGATEQLAANEESMCLGFLKRAIDEKWQQLAPQIGRAGIVAIRIQFNRSGFIASVTIANSCGDATSDAAALRVVKSLGRVRGLTSAFLDKYSRETIKINYTIQNLR